MADAAAASPVLTFLLKMHVMSSAVRIGKGVEEVVIIEAL